ncbi:13649_t:CDS:2 [Gigaspora rosea]|nr:13649_t:CDS:2 [Gigaspora rosea]
MGESSIVSPYDLIPLDLIAQETIALIKHSESNDLICYDGLWERAY